MIHVKNEAELEGMRASGRLVGRIRDAVAARVAPGGSTGELADYAHELITAAGAQNAFLGYRGYPGKICVSVNDEVVHGVPGPRRIRLGDLVSIDIGLKLDGFVGDSALTVMAGVVDPEWAALVEAARRALAAGIAAAEAGRRVSDISHAVQTVVERAGFSAVRDFVGHGIGRSMHEEPQIPNFGAPGKGAVLKAGMTLAIEPMLNLGAAGVRVDASDGWTVRTADGSASAHFEHMVAVRNGPAEVLSL
jgi:methionyl aminopeptidase